MAAGDGAVKVLDLGLAKIQEEEARDITDSGQLMGTVDYMAPEQGTDIRHVDARTDIYSLGCTLYHLLAGEPPYGKRSVREVFFAHVSAPVPSLRDTRLEVPNALSDLVQKMMAKEPDDRPQSMLEVADALQEFESSDCWIAEAEEDTSTSEPEMKSSAPRNPQDSGARRKPPMIAIAAGGAAAFLILLGILISIKTPKGTIEITVDQPDAQVTVDGEVVTLRSPNGAEPTTVRIAEGGHTLIVSKGGFKTHTKSFTLASGDREVFEVQLVPLKIEQDAPTPRPQPTTVDSTSGGGWRKLLPEVDLERDVVFGSWSWNDQKQLMVEYDKDFPKLMLPFALQGSYEVEVQFRRVSGDDDVYLILPVAGRQAVVHTYAWSEWLGLGGFETVIKDATHPARTEMQWESGRDYTLGAKVIVDDDAVQITLLVDGEICLDWRGQVNDFCNPERSMTMPRGDVLGLATRKTKVVFANVRVRELQGEQPQSPSSDALSDEAKDNRVMSPEDEQQDVGPPAFGQLVKSIDLGGVAIWSVAFSPGGETLVANRGRRGNTLEYPGLQTDRSPHDWQSVQSRLCAWRFCCCYITWPPFS